MRAGLVKKNLKLSGRRIDIKTLAQKVSERYNVSIGELRSGGRRSAVVKARHAMSWIGVRKVGYSGADLARGITVSLGPAKFQKDMVFSDLIRDVEEKLYSAKTPGRNQMVFK